MILFKLILRRKIEIAGLSYSGKSKFALFDLKMYKRGPFALANFPVKQKRPFFCFGSFQKL